MSFWVGRSRSGALQMAWKHLNWGKGIKPFLIFGYLEAEIQSALCKEINTK